MKKIKVLIITGTMNLGGIENQMMHLLRKADPNRFRIDFTTTLPHPYFRPEISSLGGRCILIPEMKVTNPLPYCRSLYRIMKEGQYDIVHSHELFHSGIVLAVAKAAGVKGRFCHAHNWQDGCGDGRGRSAVRSVYNFLMRKLIRRYSTHYLACSTLCAKFLYGEDILSQSSFHLIYNSVDTGKFLDFSHREKIENADDEWVNVLHVGRVTPVKNQLFLSDIAAEFKKRGRKVRILCAGGGNEDYLCKLRSTIDKKELSPFLQLLGPRDDIAALMAKARAFVLPSHYEGMPLVVIEAQTAGLFCVCADTFSHEVDFGLNQIRWLSVSDSPGVWADALEAAIASPIPEKEELVRVIREKGFDSASFTDKLCRLYTDCAAGDTI